MSFLDKFEQSVERAVNKTFAKVFRSEIKPVDLASALRREVDDRAAVVDRSRTVVPNDFTIELSAADFDHIESWGAETLADELAINVTDYSGTQNYAFVGPVVVSFEQNDSLETGRFQVRSSSVRGTVAPATGVGSSSRHPLLDIDGQRYLLTGPVTVIGRGTEADIVVDDPGVSRRHLEIKVTPNGVIASDMGSTNGLYVEGHQVPAATLLDGNSLTIGRTRIMFWMGVADDADLGNR